MKGRKWSMIGIAIVGVLLLPYVASGVAGGMRDTNRRDSSGLAPRPENHPEAVLQVYAAAVYGWRGLVADHTWVSVKRSGNQEYTVYQVLGWRLNRGRSVVSISEGIPDRYWWGSRPKLLADFRGGEAEDLIARVDRAARRYPYRNEYSMWPGPNSNSFTAWIALEVPDLEIDLPWRALGKNWMEENYVAAGAD